GGGGHGGRLRRRRHLRGQQQPHLPERGPPPRPRRPPAQEGRAAGLLLAEGEVRLAGGGGRGGPAGPGRYRGRSSSALAALRPLAAMTLPPGWVPAPQSQSPGLGVAGVKRRSHIWSGRHSPWKMWPPVRPMRASTSGGASTWRPTMQSATSGAKRAISAMTASAIPSRRDSQSPSARASAYGTYWAKTLIVWAPGGATLVS